MVLFMPWLRWEFLPCKHRAGFSPVPPRLPILNFTASAVDPKLRQPTKGSEEKSPMSKGEWGREEQKRERKQGSHARKDHPPHQAEDSPLSPLLSLLSLE